MGSIVKEDVTKMQGICIKCNACYKKCPNKARYFDDEGYIYHKEELEDLYKRRADNRFFM
jgi:ferredoxin